MQYAWIENNVIRDIAHDEPTAIYHPEIAKFYDTQVPDECENGWQLINNIWTKPIVQEVIAPVEIITKATVSTLSPIAFKLRFTAPERVAIYASADAIVKDFISILDDSRLQAVDLKLVDTIEAVNHLAQLGLITTDRVNEILL